MQKHISRLYSQWKSVFGTSARSYFIKSCDLLLAHTQQTKHNKKREKWKRCSMKHSDSEWERKRENFKDVYNKAKLLLYLLNCANIAIQLAVWCVALLKRNFSNVLWHTISPWKRIFDGKITRERESERMK